MLGVQNDLQGICCKHISCNESVMLGMSYAAAGSNSLSYMCVLIRSDHIVHSSDFTFVCELSSLVILIRIIQPHYMHELMRSVLICSRNVDYFNVTAHHCCRACFGKCTACIL